ncbi:TrkA C-terminal domain-containing protein [Halomarina ordinaria]|uniref:TrkA C-terminal domain-containing protein n=1 Tax=Halomarina ordinaria TaxID=3033939 RepID=A0ABD5U328_9EURY|nr:TrkA C-terminal domain-containing protein [Halomarina sp. PSRA2]
MASLPVEVLVGIYLGLLTGVIPALVSWLLGFVVRYFTGVSIPGFGVVVLGLAIAGVNGGLLALNDPTVLASGARVAVAIVVIIMMSLYAHARGDTMAADFPRHVSLRSLRERTLSADVVELVGGRDEVRVHVVGDVGHMEGYPPLSPALRARIRETEWRLPGDLPLSELEARVADRLRTEFDLADAVVRIDERGGARVDAAPPLSGLSKRVPPGERAVSLDALVPTGLARGDEVTLRAGDERVAGTVVSARSTTGGAEGADTPSTAPADDATGAPDTTDADDDAHTPSSASAPTATGGEGRLTVAVSRADARTLLGDADPTVVVEARGTRREFELLAVLRRAGRRVRRLTVGDGPLTARSLADLDLRAEYDVAVLAVRRDGEWRFVPDGETRLRSGDELFALGASDALSRFAEVAG